MFKYYCFCVAVFFARIMPMRLGYFVAELGGRIVYLFSSGRRKNVSNNIKLAVGAGEDKSVIRHKTRQVFKNSAKNYFDLTKIPHKNLEKLFDKVAIEGLPFLRKAVNDGKGVIIATAHLGNFEFGAHAVASRGFDMMILVEAFHNAPFLKKLAEMRKGKRVKIHPVGVSGMKESIQTLRRGGIVTIVCDRDINSTGRKVHFLGRETSFPVGVVDLARRTGAVIVPIFSLRGPGGKTSIFVEPPLKKSRSENRDQAEKENLQSLAAVIEKYVRRYPEQWVVLEG
jgi:lauroyl/myristoyl acyltransferase